MTHITHARVFVETYWDITNLGQLAAQLSAHAARAPAPAIEKERMALIGWDAHAICVIAAQRTMNFLNNGRTIAALKDLLPRRSQHTDHLVEIAAKPTLLVSRPPIPRHEGRSLTLLPTLEMTSTEPIIYSPMARAVMAGGQGGQAQPLLSTLLE